MLPSMASVVSGQTDSLDSANIAADRAPRLFLGLAASYAPVTVAFGQLATSPYVLAPACGGVFSGGTGRSLSAAALVEIPNLTLPVIGTAAIEFLPTYVRTTASLRSNVPTPDPAFDAKSEVVVQTRARWELELTRQDVALTILGRSGGSGALHGDLGVTLWRTVSFEQNLSQLLVDPPTAIFRTNGARREDFGDPGLGLPPVGMAAMAAVDYDLPIGEASTLTPRLSVCVPLTTSTANGTWRQSAISLGAALRIGLLRPEPPPPAPRPLPKIAASILTRPSTVQVDIDEYDSIEALPMLNDVFFSEGSAEIPARYHLLAADSVGAFSRSHLVGSALDVYHDMLNLVGLRMREIPDATLRIAGFRSSRERDTTLGRRRAEAVAAYLRTEWNLAPGRLTVVGDGLPPDPARENTPEGFEENQRVEIDASDPNVTAPHLRRHVRRIANPPGLVFYPGATAEAGVDAWSLDVMQDDHPWRSFSGRGTPPDSIVWNWRSDGSTLPMIPMHLSYVLHIRDSVGQTATTPESAIDVRYHTAHSRLRHTENDSTVESYSLLLFDYDSPHVSPGDRELLRAIAAQGVSPRATVRLTGYTDSIGDAAYNRRLANDRAAETARLFGELIPPQTTIIVDRNGGERERFPYDTPEGRMHDRTVIIEIRTPAEAAPAPPGSDEGS